MLNLAGKRAHFQRNRCSTSPVLPLIFGGVCTLTAGAFTDSFAKLFSSADLNTEKPPRPVASEIL